MLLNEERKPNTLLLYNCSRGHIRRQSDLFHAIVLWQIYIYIQPFRISRVIYWPSTEPSIKRCTCVNKRKNSGSRRTLDNNITDGSSQLETRCWSESQRQTEGFRPSVTHGWATPVKMTKKCCYGREKNSGRYSSLSPSPTSLSHTTNITFSRIKCERYIFIKKCVRSFIEVRILCLIIFPHIFIVVTSIDKIRRYFVSVQFD